MASFLRIIRQARWLKHPDLDWMAPSEIQGDALGDLQTRENKLSVYRVESENAAERVAIALAANRDNLANFDYAVIDDVKLLSTDIKISRQIGETPDHEVNQLHYDLFDLTIGRLVQFAFIVSAAERSRIPRKDVKTKLRQAIHAGVLDKSKLSPKLSDAVLAGCGKRVL